ncbi:type VI secretion system ImpH/TssG family protein/type VI secretion system VasI/ImpG family protein [Paraburkholderia sp. BL6669N2]|nr:type VI secretion system ImpH/TssG family protein/type VI secretion system VasI/ImpG family protein [Paraburkholderia sp. BL6669N2]
MERARFDLPMPGVALSPESVERLMAEPWRYGFISLLRRIGADPHIDPVGTARRPQAEPFRLGQAPSLAFAPREIADVREVNGRLKIRLLSLGMFGPNGPLPIHVTEIAREREQNRRDATLVNFLDIFHHRYLTLLYRAWASAQAAAGLDRKDDETFSFFVASLAGHDPAEIAGRPFPGHARLAASAHLVREARNPDGLRATLEQYFDVPVAIEEYVFHWLEMAPASHSYLGKPVESSTLAMGAMLGEQVPDRQHRFRIVLGPLDLQAYLRFTAQGVDLPKLVECVREFVGRGYRWELELRIKPQGAPPAVLGGTEQLGWSSWLGQAPTDAPITGMRFEPEQYVEQLARRSVPYRQRPETGAGDLLAYYNEELLYLRELAAEFGQAHVKIARRLGMQAGEIGDRYVERLVQAFAFMSARMRMKLDAAFPDFTRPLLQCLYPNYLAPTPSMAVARLYPDHARSKLAQGFHVPRGSPFASPVPEGGGCVCQFRSTQDVTLYPLEIVSARLTGIPPDISALDRYVRPDRNVRSALRLRLRATGSATIGQLRGLDRLPVYLAGDVRLASQLFELLHTGAAASVLAAPGSFATAQEPLHVVRNQAVMHEGFGTDQAMLPLVWPKFHGHNLLHEYATCPERFLFFTLTGLEAGLRRIEAQEVEIVVLLDRPAGELVNRVDASHFALFCTPVINLFPVTIDRLELPENSTTASLHVDPLAPADYEVFSVGTLSGFETRESASLEFQPRYPTLARDENSTGRYFVTRREPARGTDLARRYQTRATYAPGDTLVSLVDANGTPAHDNIRFITAQVWVTNRDLPNLLAVNGVDDLSTVVNAPLASVGLIRAPGTPKRPLAQGTTAWRLVRQLNFNHLPLEDTGGAGLRELLLLYRTGDNPGFVKQVQAITGVQMQTVTRRLPGAGDLVFGCGTGCTLTVDEGALAGESPYLLGVILEHYLARHVPTHTFVQTSMRSVQRGPVALWPPRMGTRSAA